MRPVKAERHIYCTRLIWERYGLENHHFWGSSGLVEQHILGSYEVFYYSDWQWHYYCCLREEWSTKRGSSAAVLRDHWVTGSWKPATSACLGTMRQLCKASLHLFILLFQLSLNPHSQMTGKIILQLHIWNPNLNKSSRAGMRAPGLDPPLFT